MLQPVQGFRPYVRGGRGMRGGKNIGKCGGNIGGHDRMCAMSQVFMLVAHNKVPSLAAAVTEVVTRMLQQRL